MIRQKLHPQGPDFSRFVWGAWRCLESAETDTPAKLARLIEGCLELGITSFDHADIYGGYRAEAHFGAALKEWAGDRRRLQLVSKCDIALVNPARPDNRLKHYDTGAGHIRASVEQSLGNLGTDHLDLLLIHRPDPLMDAEETAEALAGLVRAGKVRHVGVSNHTPGQIDLLQSRLALPIVTNQIEFSVLHTAPLQDGTLDQAQRLRAAPMIWSPLGGGALYTGATPQAEAVKRVLQEIGRVRGIEDIGRLALAWLLRHPSRPVVVLGTSRLDRLRGLVAADPSDIDRQDWFAVLEASVGRPVP